MGMNNERDILLATSLPTMLMALFILKLLFQLRYNAKWNFHQTLLPGLGDYRRL